MHALSLTILKCDEYENLMNWPISYFFHSILSCTDPECGQGVPLMENYKAIWLHRNTVADPFENHKAAKPNFNVKPLSVHQRNTISMAFCLRADDGPLLVVFGSSPPSLT